jgi:hypothetical protein
MFDLIFVFFLIKFKLCKKNSPLLLTKNCKFYNISYNIIIISIILFKVIKEKIKFNCDKN